MERFETDDNYYSAVIEFLEKEIAKKKRGYTVQKNFPCTISWNTHILDLVELDQNSTIIAIYEVFEFVAYWSRYYSLLQYLYIIRSQTGAQEVYSVFFDSRKKLQCLSLNDLIKNKIPIIPFVETVYTQFPKCRLLPVNNLDMGNPFSQFVTILYNWCGDELQCSDLKLFFRGHSNKEYKPLPSIFRNDKSIAHENIIFNEAIQRNPSDFTPDMTAFDDLVKMQHYELPTRLLDITSNPLVALYFACHEAKNEDGTDADGEVLVYLISKEQIKYRDSDVVCLLSNLARRPMHFSFEDDKKQRKYLFEDVYNDKPTYNEDAKWNSAIHEVYCVLPKQNNDRIIKQSGAFFIFGMGKTKDKPAALIIEPSRIIIKADAKTMILKALNLLGINEASLFPETDKVMHQIKKEYC